MRQLILLALTVLFLALIAVAEEKQPPPAWTLAGLSSSLTLQSVETMESAPPQFALNLSIDMPEPQWKLELVSAGKPDADGRILVKLKGTRSKDVDLPQVITPTAVRVPVGSLVARRYVVDVIVAMDDLGSRPAGALLLDARER